MLRSSVRVLLISAVILAAAGCRDSEPEALYNYDLGGDGNHLLPASGIVHRAHDPGVNRGSSRADLYRLGDEVAPEQTAPTPIEGVAADLPPAESVSGALGNVGKAFLGNLMSGGTSSSTGAVAGAGSTDEAVAETSGEVTAEAAASGDIEGVETLVADVNAAFAARQFPHLAELCVERQRSTAGRMFEMMDELNASVNALMDAQDQAAAGSKAPFETRIAEASSAFTLSNLSATGADSATGELTRAGNAAVSVSFEREDGQWRIVYPMVPEAADWPSRETSLRDLIDRLDDLLGEVQGGSGDSAQVESALNDAIATLFQFGA